MFLFTCLGLWLSFVSGVSRAEPVEFVANVDRNQISLDESLQLKIEVKVEGTAQVGDLRYDAPDFEVINEFNSNFVQSFYENGHFGVRNTQQLTKILRPKKTGLLTISNISINVEGTRYKANTISVQVEAAGQGSPPPRGYGGAGVGLRGSGKNSRKPQFFLRAELDKDKVFKGEQVIVSYYLYRRVNVFNIQVDKFPVLGGFLREDLDMPVMATGGRLQTERVNLDGSAYERSLLARYAAYPLKEGKLEIDSMSLRLNYRAQGSAPDPFNDDDILSQFFRNTQMQAGTAASEIIKVDVMPLPLDKQPSSFTGGVGDFQVSAAVDKNQTHVNDALTLTLKIEGRGNTSSVEVPKINWPENLELFESKGKATKTRAGVGSKVFEMILIPRREGTFKIPPIELSFFDPIKKDFVTKSTQPIEFSALPAQAVSAPATNPAVKNAPKAEEDVTEPSSSNIWAGIKKIAMFLGTFMVLIGFVWILMKGYTPARSNEADIEPEKPTVTLEKKVEPAIQNLKSWNKLKELGNSIQTGSSWNQVLTGYELLCGAIYDLLDRNYSFSSRSMARSDMEVFLTQEKKMDQPLWRRIEKLLEFSEAVRYASSAGAVAEATARNSFAQWVKEAQDIEQELNRREPQV